MPGYEPTSVYPFSVNALVVVAQVWNAVWGSNYSYSYRLFPCFSICAIVLCVLPFEAHIGGGQAYWLVFATLIFFGWFSGIA